MSKIENTKETWNGKTYSEVEEFIKEELDSKAEKVRDSERGNLAALDGEGNLTDSGYSPDDFLTDHQPLKTINGIQLAGEGNIEIPRGNDAVNPFKGWFDSAEHLQAAYPAPALGDYAYVKGADPSEPADIYEEVDGEWVDSGRDADTTGTGAFATGEPITTIAIDNTNLRDPDVSSIPKAIDVARIKAKTSHATLAEEKVDTNGLTDYTVNGSTGYYAPNGTWKVSNNNKVTRIDIGGYRYVRFLGVERRDAPTSGNVTYLFFDADNNIIADSIGEYDINAAENGLKEYFVDIPEEASYFIVAYNQLSILNKANFYCYLSKGSVLLSEDDVADNLDCDDPRKALSAKQGKAIAERIKGVEGMFDHAEEIRKNVFSWDNGRCDSDFEIKKLNGKEYTYENFGCLIHGADDNHTSPYWGAAANTTRWIIVKVKGGDVLHYDSHGANLWIAVLTRNPVVKFGDPVPISSAQGFTDTINLNNLNNGKGLITMPGDATGLYVVTRNSNGEVPGELYSLEETFVSGIDGLCSSIMKNLEADKEDTYFGSGVEQLAIIMSAGNTLTPLAYNLTEHDGQLHEAPPSVQHRALVEKAKELAYIRWVPKANIPYHNGNNDYLEGNPYFGLPYSSVKEMDKFVGLQVSVETFMTAVNNPFSLMYTENVRDTTPRSAWGKVYHGTNCATYYGTVCSQFTSYCAGFSIMYATQMHEWLFKHAHKLVRLYNQSDNNLQIGDILMEYSKRNGKAHHALIVTGIRRSSDNLVTGITIAESVGLGIREHDEETFMLPPNNDSYRIVYRPMELYKNIVRDESAGSFVDISSLDTYKTYDRNNLTQSDMDELCAAQRSIVYNNEICTFAGNKACFAEGELVVINYNLYQDPDFGGRFSAIEIYKDDALYAEYSLESLPQIPDGIEGTDNALYLGTELEPGSYKAKMAGSILEDPYTYFEVIDTSHVAVTTDDETEMSTVVFPSDNGTPVAVNVCEENGHSIAARELTEDEVVTGRIYSNFVKLSRIQNPGDYDGAKQYYLKVYFKGVYGMTRAMVPLNAVLQ